MVDRSGKSFFRRGDITASSSRDSSKKASEFNYIRHLAHLNDQHDMSSPSGYDRGYNTRDVWQSSAGYQERQTDGAGGQGGSPGGYSRAYNTYDARRGYSNESPHLHMVGKSSAGYPETRKDIEEVIKQREGKTSFGSEISLGYNTERYPMRGGTSEEAQEYLDSLSAEDRVEFDLRYDNNYGTQRGDEIYDHWVQLYYREARSPDTSPNYYASPSYHQEYSHQEIEELDQVERGMHPTQFLTTDENNDYDAAPNNANEMTSSQKFAVYMYNRTKKLIDLGWGERGIKDKLRTKRIRYFLTKEEKKNYDAAPNDANERTDEQQTAVKLYNRVKEAFSEEYKYNDVRDIYNRYKSEYANERGQEQAGSSHQSDQNRRIQDIHILVDLLHNRLGGGSHQRHIHDESVTRIKQNGLSKDEFEYAKEYLDENYDELSSNSRWRVIQAIRKFKE